MKMPKIKKSALEDLCIAARNTFPNEFIALLSSSKRNGIIDEFVVLPAVYGDRFASVRLDLMPVDKSIVGSIHSHPGRSALPSPADLGVFKRTGEMHLIIAYPFSFETARAFDAKGKELAIEMVE